MLDLIWLVPLLPLIGFLVNGLGRDILPKNVVAFIGSGVVLFSFFISCVLFYDVYQLRQSGEDGTSIVTIFQWFGAGALNVSMSFLLDPLSSIMLLIVTGVGFLIHVYSIGYMKLDPGFNKFFSYLNLFIFFMLLLVLGSNYLVMFIGWEGVGLCSYLLIGFWFKNSSFASAGKKAFVMNRIGDLSFLIAVLLIFITFGTIEFAGVFPQAAGLASGDSMIVLISFLLFIAATGKSAQIPLFTWLPDAMAGPTPVSALIHAATMVTAGVYMIARSNILFTLSPVVMQLIAVIGLLTALMAAATALTQNDIKKVLAYSTVSQLGYMFLGLGVGAFTGALFHVITHAFFKALLFLGAGSVIHAMSDEQDLRSMGGLRKKLPVTYITMLIGTIAIAGIPPLSGFFSKDEILAYAFSENKMLWVGGLIGALFTSFYMFRLLFLTFFGKFRGTFDQEKHIHESPVSMKFPLIVLAVLSIVGGLLNIPSSLGGGAFLAQFLSPVFADSAALTQPFHLDHSTEYILMSVSAVAAILMAIYAYTKYVQKEVVPEADHVERSFLERLSYHKFYVDEIYDFLIVNPLNSFSRFLYRIVDRSGIDGIVNGLGRGVSESGKMLRLLQSGNVGFYLFLMVIGAVLLLFYGIYTI
ncbi:NADH-quinone oxidoreductase subunit L [Albibacterium bauzanense]|uniref:NADH dehydrogenase subunit L n=1 Tax=Albibacterium bauzanense TaxID=653929 RepID=A0A4R1LU11_9SPHI|nr:NADH-quinone oxidoreductase subunit L [Albibacterium bauzanense]TCK82828.1 NADH dehydrogenase subunit L [Albibacterium bauzanense]